MLDERLVFSYIFCFQLFIWFTFDSECSKQHNILKKCCGTSIFIFIFKAYILYPQHHILISQNILQKQKVHISHKYNILFSHLTSYL